MVEHRTENSGVRGSIPFIGKINLYYLYFLTLILCKKIKTIKKYEKIVHFYLFYLLNYKCLFYQLKYTEQSRLSTFFFKTNKFLFFNIKPTLVNTPTLLF